MVVLDSLLTAITLAMGAQHQRRKDAVENQHSYALRGRFPCSRIARTISNAPKTSA
jgi:hypothetical protein